LDAHPVPHQPGELGSTIDRTPPRADQEPPASEKSEGGEPPGIRIGAGGDVADHAQDGVADRLQTGALVNFKQVLTDRLGQQFAGGEPLLGLRRAGVEMRPRPRATSPFCQVVTTFSSVNAI
jgi:hypothetical protein